MKHFATLLLLLLCARTKTVSMTQLDAAANAQNGNSFPNRVFYVGSGGRYDHFVIRGFGGSAKYRVLQSEGAVTKRFTITKDEAQWQGYGINSISSSLTVELLATAIHGRAVDCFAPFVRVVHLRCVGPIRASELWDFIFASSPKT